MINRHLEENVVAFRGQLLQEGSCHANLISFLDRALRFMD